MPHLIPEEANSDEEDGEENNMDDYYMSSYLETTDNNDEGEDIDDQEMEEPHLSPLLSSFHQIFEPYATIVNENKLFSLKYVPFHSMNYVNSNLKHKDLHLKSYFPSFSIRKAGFQSHK